MLGQLRRGREAGLASLGLEGLHGEGPHSEPPLGSLGRGVWGMRERTALARGLEGDEAAEFQPDTSPSSTSLPSFRF